MEEVTALIFVLGWGSRLDVMADLENPKGGQNMAQIGTCQECNGVIDANNFQIPQVGGISISSMVYPCSSCGRCHNEDSVPVEKDGNRLYYVSTTREFQWRDTDGQIVRKFRRP